MAILSMRTGARIGDLLAIAVTTWAMSLLACTYNLGELRGPRADGAAGIDGHEAGLDVGAADSVVSPDAGDSAAQGGQSGAGRDGGAGAAGADAAGGDSGGRANGAGCTSNGDCSSGHCVRAVTTDAAGICCDGVPGECTVCSNGYRVPVNDDTLIGCHLCKAGVPTPYSGPIDVGNDMQDVCLEGAHYQEPTTGPCARKGWSITATPPCDATCLETPVPPNAIDGNLSTRFTTGHPQGSLGSETLLLTFPAPISASGLWLFSGGPDDGPAAYRVEYSTDGATFTAFPPGVMGTGVRNLTVTFPTKTVMRALRITQTGTKPLSWWSIAEMNVLDCAAQ